MQLPTVKTYEPKAKKEDFQFYVLSKGHNAGRPAHAPNVNSFTVTCYSEKDRDHFYSLCYALWKGRCFHPHLIGSVVEFIRIKEFKAVLQSASNKLQGKEDSLTKVVGSLKKIEQTERLMEEQRKTIVKMRAVLVRQMLNEVHKPTLPETAEYPVTISA
jgi:hypothetical protein